MENPRYVSYTQVLARHGWWIALATIVCAGLAYAICLLPSLRMYQAQATIVFPLRQSGLGLRRSLGSVDLPIGGAGAAISGLQQMYPAVTILESRRVAELVLAKHPELRPRLDRKNRGDRVAIHNKLVKKYLEIDDTDQGALKIKFLWWDANTAAEVANEFVASLRFVLSELNNQRAAMMADFIGERLGEGVEGSPGIRARIEKLEGEIADYKTRHEIPALTAQAEQLIKTAAALQEDLTTSEVELAGSQMELEAIRRQGSRLEDVAEDLRPSRDLFDLEAVKDDELITLVAEEDTWRAVPPAKALEDPAIATLRRQLSTLESQRSEKLLLFTADHPEIIRLNKDIYSLRRLLYNELVKFNDSSEVALMVDTVALRARRDAAQRMLGDINAQITAFPAKEQGLVRLERERLLLDKVYVLLAQELEQSRLAAQAQDTTFTVLDDAIAPTKPARPRRLRAAGSVGVLVFVAALLFAAGKERRALPLEPVAG
ncbi:MAG TPA: hypothetical protein VEI97_09525 [bacterium]|nr:hypothetical protein [bacterium]